MSLEDRVMLQHTIAAFSRSIALLSIEIEQCGDGTFKRQQFATALTDAAQAIPDGSGLIKIEKAILTNIAAQVAGQLGMPVLL